MRNRRKTLLRDHSVPEVILQACPKHIQSQPYLRPSPLEDLKDLPQGTKSDVMIPVSIDMSMLQDSSSTHHIDPQMDTSAPTFNGSSLHVRIQETSHLLRCYRM